MEEPLKNKRYSLFNMLGIVKGVSENLEHIRSKVGEEKEKLHQIADEYHEKRINLLELELEEKGKTWCTVCSKVIPKSKATLLFFTGKKYESGGYGNSYYSHEKFDQLHRTCPKCRKKAEARHGERGERDSQLNSYTYFYAFRVRKRKGGYYFNKFGEWVKLEDKYCELPGFPTRSSEDIAGEIEIDLPPKVNVSWPKAELKVLE
ncbi:hypothetical protein ACFLZS_01555 [Patescibacteria group bacterium]